MALTVLAGGHAGAFAISAPAFAEGQPMPAHFAYRGDNVSPELRISGAPAGTVCFALIVEDPDAPSGLWTHWLVANIPPGTTRIAEGQLPAGAVVGRNSFHNARYDGPVPPSGTHRYVFHLYALDRPVHVPASFSRTALEAQFDHHVLGTCETFGTYAASP
ncbi:MAG: YbhB/YbcL family Raf kinase inhibitor-like protein [Verrucomicrobiota bacterium]